MTKIVYNFNKYKYLIGSLIIILVPIIIVLVTQFDNNNIYIYYDTNIVYCKNLKEFKKKEYLMCYNNNEYSLKVKEKQPIDVIENLKKIELTSIKEFFTNSMQNKNLFLVIRKNNKYHVLPVKIYQNLS
ncbi:hypothetical protein [Tenacibaculum sp. nBUS_03]|uniref:hypothetical protein n=1 Tax=Tenacibaculum sp. nBUS_03 TaxID=3395320 RepID=UPI003EB9F17B